MTNTQQTADRPQMLTIPQLAALNILPERAIRRLIQEDRIKSIQVGNRRYVNLPAFKRFLSGEGGE